MPLNCSYKNSWLILWYGYFTTKKKYGLLSLPHSVSMSAPVTKLLCWDQSGVPALQLLRVQWERWTLTVGP